MKQVRITPQSHETLKTSPMETPSLCSPPAQGHVSLCPQAPWVRRRRNQETEVTASPTPDPKLIPSGPIAPGALSYPQKARKVETTWEWK